MNKTKLIYWISTILFSLLMISTAIPDLIMTEEALKFMGQLGYPPYFTFFIGLAKILGSIAILIPGFKLIKEWAYAGLFFDLIGAVYSIFAIGAIDAGLTFFILPFGLGITSYIYNRIYFQSSNA